MEKSPSWRQGGSENDTDENDTRMVLAGRKGRPQGEELPGIQRGGLEAKG